MAGGCLAIPRSFYARFAKSKITAVEMIKSNLLSKVDLTKPPKIDFLKSLTTQTGILQHTKYGIPHRSLGYSLDDNARALIVMIRAYKLFKKKEYLDLARVYISFIIQAKEAGNFFYNFQTFEHKFLPKVSQDSFGETLWALAETIEVKIDPSLSNLAKELFSETEQNIAKINSPRAVAYTIIALYHILKVNPKNKSAYKNLEKLTKALLKLYGKYSDKDWTWFESFLTYANHILPTALFYAYLVLKDEEVLKLARQSLSFLEGCSHTADGVPSPIGSHGWYFKGEEKATFDQQPVEASYAVIANLAAYEATKKKEYKLAALDWVAWFHGNNINKVKVYNVSTGGCYDAVNAEGVNLNQGAEPIICYLLASLALSTSLRKK